MVEVILQQNYWWRDATEYQSDRGVEYAACRKFISGTANFVAKKWSTDGSKGIEGVE
jgi:hypothetical protein